jgi:outer membrane protein with beta-barrel domain
MNTKVRAFLFGITMAVSVTAFGQAQQTSNETHVRPKLGIKGAFDLTTLYANTVGTTNTKPGFDAGIYTKLPVDKGFSFQVELLYSLKGAKYTYNNFVQGHGEYRYNLGYIQVPVLAVVNVTPWFNIHAGGYAAYMTNANVKDVRADGTIVGATDLNTGDFMPWDFGLVGGVGFDVENFTFGARYNYGLTHIGRPGQLSGYLTDNAKNAGLSIYAGFGF